MAQQNEGARSTDQAPFKWSRRESLCKAGIYGDMPDSAVTLTVTPPLLATPCGVGPVS
jgi:hypothetical protein